MCVIAWGGRVFGFEGAIIRSSKGDIRGISGVKTIAHTIRPRTNPLGLYSSDLGLDVYG